MRRPSALLVVLLLVTSLPALSLAAADVGAGATGSTAGSVADAGAIHTAISPTSPSATSTGGDVLHQHAALRQLPDRPGEFEAEVTVSVPDAVRSLEVRPRADAEVTATDGFEPTDDGYAWTESTDEPSLTLLVSANVTRVDERHPAATDEFAGTSDGFGGSTSPTTHTHDHTGDGFYFVETGSWGIVKVPRLSMSWRETRSVRTDRSVSVDGPGAAGTSVAVFGPVTEYVGEAGSETHRLVVPEASEMAESPVAVLDALEAANDRLRIGAETPELFVVAAPTGDVEWGPNGLQYGVADAWVRDDARLDRPNNVWFHEYVHSRQAFAGVADGTTSETRWLIEGQADYYAALLGLEEGLIGYDDFRSFLERGQSSPYDEGILSIPATWGDDRTDYARGPLALGAIDREIRLATDGERTMVDVFRTLNRAEAPIEQATFLDAVEAYGGETVREVAVRYAETEAIPDTWSRHEHRRVFDVDRVAVETRLGDGPVEIDGPYRTESADTIPALVPDETITLPVRVTNVDERTGPYDASLTVDGEIVDERTGRLDPGESTDEHLSWTPEAPGSYDVRVGEDRFTIEVAPAAPMTVTDVRADPSRISAGETVTVTATVTGDPDRPAGGTVTVATHAGTADEHDVRLGPGETTTVETAIRFDADGRYEVRVGDRSTIVAVGTLAGLEQRLFGAADAIADAGTAVVVGALVALFAAIVAGAAVVGRRR